MSGANLFEIFSSVQGEGVHVGATTLFVRFGGCDLRCRWCDSPHTWEPASNCRIESGRGSGTFYTRPNPLAIGEVVYFHVDPDCMTGGYIDMKKLLPIGRLNGFFYSTLGDIFEREFHDGQPR